MKSRLLLGLLFALTLSSALARADVFPGLKVIMTPEDYARAGLAQLTPDQIGVIDAALIRHFAASVNVAADRQAATHVSVATTQAVAADRKLSGLARFGLPDFSGDWRNEPVLKARATGWVGGNRFSLDNGQVWEGLETISFELVGRNVEIQPRPANTFALTIDGKNTTVRVRRIK